jgi:Putative zinc-finger
MKWMQYTCREAAELLSLRRDEPLGFWRAVGLKLHLGVCGDCREVDKQLDQLSELSAGLWRDATRAGKDDGSSQR